MRTSKWIAMVKQLPDESLPHDQYETELMGMAEDIVERGIKFILAFRLAGGLVMKQNIEHIHEVKQEIGTFGIYPEREQKGAKKVLIGLRTIYTPASFDEYFDVYHQAQREGHDLKLYFRQTVDELEESKNNKSKFYTHLLLTSANIPLKSPREFYDCLTKGAEQIVKIKTEYLRKHRISVDEVVMWTRKDDDPVLDFLSESLKETMHYQSQTFMHLTNEKITTKNLREFVKELQAGRICKIKLYK